MTSGRQTAGEALAVLPSNERADQVLLDKFIGMRLMGSDDVVGRGQQHMPAQASSIYSHVSAGNSDTELRLAKDVCAGRSRAGCICPRRRPRTKGVDACSAVTVAGAM
jgi:hypothetical protein